ncbi:MAG: O-antigen ligase family protein [Bacilli bacterium]|nr:O-antigen ligase family protein [Bacilli bacterium]
MTNFIKKNIGLIIAVFIVLGPVIDLLTGLCLHMLNINLTLGIILRVLFLLFICYTTVFIYHKRKLLWPYLLIGIYGIFYVIGIICYKNGVGLFSEIQGLVKVFYFPILFLSLYSIRDEINISKMTLFTTLFLYLIFIFVPILLGVGFETYKITKAGTLGFYNSANEISGIISLLTPIMFTVLVSSRKIVPKMLLGLMYFVVILMIGTKTPLISLTITVMAIIIYLWRDYFIKKQYKKILISVIVLLVGVSALLVIIPKTNFYKNIETHLNYLELENVGEVFEDEELVDHFIFSQRLTFLDRKATLYRKANVYQKLFGIGYLKKNGKPTKLIEMDYFDIFYNHGIIGFLIFFSITLYVLWKVLRKEKTLNFESYMTFISLLLIIFLSFFTGHIITAPAVSLIAIILILGFPKRKKKRLLFTSYSMDVGGIEKALLNLVNRINTDKYDVTIVLEKKHGVFLDKIKDEVRVEECKVSNNKNVLLRKLINGTHKLVFKIFEYHNYDFSCCYATYSYSSSKLALMSSKNTAFYVHNDYRTIYKNDADFYEFFNSREINRYKNIIFVSNENREGFVKKYPELKKRCRVFNNFINTEEIIKQSQENIKEKKDKKHTLFMFVGRLDDDAKKISRQINLVKEIDDIDLWIIGDGPDRHKYEKEVKDNKLEKRVTFMGKKSNPFPYMAQADYVILTSDYEGFPVTYLEAITLNKDIITTFPTSDDQVDIHEYGYVISKDQTKMVKEVKDILKKKKSRLEIDLEAGQVERMKQLEKIFNE